MVKKASITGLAPNKRQKIGEEGYVAFWFRNDLRTHDNPALFSASTSAKELGVPLVGIFLLSPEEWIAHDLAPIKIDFIQRTLKDLESTLQEFNIPLLVLKVPEGSRSSTIMADYLQSINAKAVFFNNEYEVDELARDAEFIKLLTKHGIMFKNFHDQCVIPPGTVLTKAGTMSKVFTPFKKAWIKYLSTIKL
jgi:deoxyribodipyrimidine photo-lyase